MNGFRPYLSERRPPTYTHKAPRGAKKARIVDAVEMGDVSQVKSIAEKVMSEFPVTSTISYKFIQLAENFDLDGILNLVQELKD